MKVSLVVNTCCHDPLVAGQKNPYRSARYGQRAALLREQVLPRALRGGFDEIIVAGVFPPTLPQEFPSITFLHVPPVRRNRWDGLVQREYGARYCTGDVIVFCHDDHAPEYGFADKLRAYAAEWDILCPRRVHALTADELNNGSDRFEEHPYMGAHCYAMRRWTWAAYPLTQAPNEWWDIHLSPIWTQMGAKIVWTDDLIHLDLEAAADER